ncbi:PilZ domain-containing protein [Syntrophobacter fumaroxidans]|uniref:Type IV pilus assembly PilZ n=1 Tax=Syntrophobacter fumaroxidans (strain DSM 10017 / MPOB) TaxID=335543 RepID=A0LGX4_SYNFM|nr:PilZ domain-containing protein [Syntrophobacter fumaroxidans]ABK16676.1 type IV pilus assembly PilZ [Syntrophobacter fumaroxidans MPOB]
MLHNIIPIEENIVMIEHRRSKRYVGKEGSFAVLIRKDEPITIGQIIDISSNGISVRYLSRKPQTVGFSYIKIFATNGHFVHMRRIECQVIYDIQIDKDSWYSLATRRCGVEFGELSIEQKMDLNNFIKQHIIEDN